VRELFELTEKVEKRLFFWEEMLLDGARLEAGVTRGVSAERGECNGDGWPEEERGVPESGERRAMVLKWKRSEAESREYYERYIKSTSIKRSREQEEKEENAVQASGCGRE
jgi:hypothetical protein